LWIAHFGLGIQQSFFLDKPEARVYLRFQPYAIVQQVLHVLNPFGTMASANFLESGFKEASMWILDRHFFLSVIGRRGGAAMLLSKAVMLLVIFFAAGRIASAQITLQH